MKKILPIFLTFCSFSISTIKGEISQPQEAAKEEMVNHLIGVQNLFQSMYAPAEWKRQYAGWDLKEAVQRAADKVNSQENITLKDFQEILVDLFNSPKDYHVGIHFYSTESATLPFRVRGSDNRYFVAWVDEEAADRFPLHVGDEILAFDGKAVREAVDLLIRLDRSDLINETDLEIASIFLTLRSGTAGHRVPQGNVDVVVKPAGAKTAQTHTLAWSYRKELIKGLPSHVAADATSGKNGPPRDIYEAMKHFNLHTDMSTPLVKAAAKISAQRASAFPVNDRRGPLPLLGDPLWTPRKPNFFFSYIFPSESGKMIGYIRIPHFQGAETDDGVQQDLEDLRLLVRAFQRKTEALVVDLTDNGGGNLDVLLSYLGTLSDTPTPFFKQKVSITQEDAYTSLLYLDEIESYLKVVEDAKDIEFLTQLQEYFSFIIDEWSAGRSLSQPVYIYGLDKVDPDAVATYKKPILVLINGLDFSCADLLPALLQDSGRATIFGSTTAGAGGAVRSYSYPNRLGIASYTYTATILERKDQSPLENLGVTPDVPYRVTPEDLQNNYKGYIEAVHKALDQVLR